MNWDKVIFLAHASEDKERVRYFCEKLLDSGLHPWLDERELTPGVEWESKIKNAIRKCRFFVAFLSPKSVEKNGFYQRELRFALSQMEEKSPNTVYIVPALLAPIDIPDITVGTVNLRRYQSVRLYEPHEQQELTKLVEALHNEIKSNPRDLALMYNLRLKLNIASSMAQMSLFPIPKTQLEQEYGKETIRKIQSLLSFDYSSLDDFHPWQEDEIRFLAGMQSFSDVAPQTSIFEFLVSRLLSIEIHNLSDLYFDVIQLCWKRFSDREFHAIENYKNSIEIDELLDILQERIEDEIDDEEIETLKQSLLDRIDRIFSHIKDKLA